MSVFDDVFKGRREDLMKKRRAEKRKEDIRNMDELSAERIKRQIEINDKIVDLGAILEDLADKKDEK